MECENHVDKRVPSKTPHMNKEFYLCSEYRLWIVIHPNHTYHKLGLRDSKSIGAHPVIGSVNRRFYGEQIMLKTNERYVLDGVRVWLSDCYNRLTSPLWLPHPMAEKYLTG